MFNQYLYKLFNPELKNLNNNQLFLFWKKNKNQNSIYSIESFFEKYPYYDHNMYKLYNKDLEINDNFELMKHWHFNGIIENRICSDKYFDSLYPNFNLIINNDDNIYDIKNLHHKNIIKSQSDIPSTGFIENSFLTKNISKDISKDISIDKSILNEKIKNNIFLKIDNKEITFYNLKLNYLLNPTKKTLGIYIFTDNFEINYYLKALSFNNFYEMNIILFYKCSGKLAINNINFIDNINIDCIIGSKDEKNLINLCEYIITDTIDILNDLKYCNQLFINKFNKDYDEGITNTTSNLLTTKILYCDDIFDNYFYENNVLITQNNNYIIKDNLLYNVNISDISKIYYKLYVNEYFINEYLMKLEIILNVDKELLFEMHDDKFANIKILNYQDDSLNYGIILSDNKYYYNLYDKYLLLDINEIKYNLPLNIGNIYINEINKNINDMNINIKINFKFNIIFIIDDSDEYYKENILFMLKQHYDNYNIILFFNNIEIINYNFIKDKKNIHIFNSKKKLSKINILLFLTRISENNSLMVIVDNKYLINYKFSLEHINILFFAKRLLVSDIFSNKYLNILIFKKEILFSIQYLDIYNILDNNVKYLSILYFYFKKTCLNYSYLNDYEFNEFNLNEYNLNEFNLNEYNLNEFNVKIGQNIYYEKKDINLLYNYLSINLDDYSKEKIMMLYDKNNIFTENIISKSLINYKNNLLNNNENYLDLLLYFYKKNKIDYNYFNNNLKYNIKNNISDVQIVIFINDDNINIKTKLEILFDIKSQINIIHFGKKYNYAIENYDINYFFLDINILNIRYSNNKSLAYNIVTDFFISHLFEYKYILFYDIYLTTDLINDLKIIKQSIISINDISLFNNNDIIINKKIFNKIGGFDPEIFIHNSSFENIFLIEKYKKLYFNTKINVKVNINNINNLVFNNFYTNINNIIKINNNNEILLNFFNKKKYIDYSIFNNIKTIIINLEERVDRLFDIKKECNKINLLNYEIFNGIKIDSEDKIIKYTKFLNKDKIWKLNNNEYYKSALGCKMSHLETLKKYINIENDYLMILEDDVIFEDNFIIYLNLALMSLKNIDWDILFLTSNLFKKDDATKINSNLLKIKHGLTTTAQIFKKDKISKIINIIEKSDVEIDNTYNDFVTEKYCIYPMCAYQKESFSDINNKILNYGKFHKKYIY